MSQLDPTDDDGFELFRGEGSGRICGRLENRVFVTQPFELICPDLAVLQDLVEAFACLFRFGGGGVVRGC